MISLLNQFPKLKLNFNLTPVLIEQILEYTTGQREDYFLTLNQTNVRYLTADEKREIIRLAFALPYKRMIEPDEDFRNLYQKWHKEPESVEKFTSDELARLQILFEKAWLDNKTRSSIKNINQLVKLDNKLLKEVLPLYQKFLKKGNIELITSPFYHPILPLICDIKTAITANSSLKMPDFEFRYPDDAQKQIRNGVELFKQVFGIRPNGIWLPEMAISEDVLKIICEQGLNWTVADDKILAKTIGKDLQKPENLPFRYISYRMRYGRGEVLILFRDSFLSDLISFEYSSWNSRLAAQDLYNRMKKISDTLPADDNFLLTIALDGENPWEWYENNGKDFLQNFYGLLSEDKELKTVKISDWLKAKRNFPVLLSLAPGSWAQGNFDTWFRSPENQKAWAKLAELRRILQEKAAKGKDVSEALDEIYILEGSDWFWWFDDNNHSVFKDEFQYLFNAHLKRAHQIIDET